MSKQIIPAHPQQAQITAQPATPGSCQAHGSRAARRSATPLGLAQPAILPGKGHSAILNLHPGGEEA